MLASEITWPVVVAILGGTVALVLGAQNLLTFNRNSTSVGDLKKEIETIKSNHGHTVGRVGKLETTLEGQVATQFEHVQEGLSRVEHKMDTLVESVVTALSQLASALSHLKKD